MLEDFITFYPVMSNKELAEIFMVSINTIRRKAKEMMLEKSPISHFRQKTIETVMRMFGKHTAREMAKEAGVSTRTIYRICKQLNLKMSKEEKSKIFSDAAYKMLKREYSRMIYGLEPSTLVAVNQQWLSGLTVTHLTKVLMGDLYQFFLGVFIATARDGQMELWILDALVLGGIVQ